MCSNSSSLDSVEYITIGLHRVDAMELGWPQVEICQASRMCSINLKTSYRRTKRLLFGSHRHNIKRHGRKCRNLGSGDHKKPFGKNSILLIVWRGEYEEVSTLRGVYREQRVFPCQSGSFLTTRAWRTLSEATGNKAK